MTNGRLGGLLGIAGIWAGLVLALAGPGIFAVTGRVLLDHAGYLLLACAAVVLVHNLAPKGALAGPVVLGTAGLVLLALGRDRWPLSDVWPVAGLVIAILATSAVLRRIGRDGGDGSALPIRRTSGLLLNRHVIYDLDAEAPERLHVDAVLSRVVIDLRSARAPVTGPLEIVVTCVAGGVELAFPGHWPVVAGRTAASRGVRLDGFVDSTETFDDPRSREQEERLRDMEEEWQERARTGDPGTAVVIHVAGAGGTVRIRDRHPAAPDPSAERGCL